MRRITLVQHREVSVNGITMHVAEQGQGPLVLLLHGFPESWYSWRHQFQPLADAGYRVVAPDQRGYGGTDAPAAVEDYSIFHLVGDVVGLIAALGEEQAVVVGHDWGAPVAWHTALLRPDLVRGVAGLSVPPTPRAARPPLASAREHFGPDFYQIYFQEPGVADAELNADPASTFRRVLAGLGDPNASGGFLARMREPEELPSWLTEDDITAFTEQYARNGFTGGLNWYRNIDRNWALTLPWQGAKITPPAFYVTGDQDIVRGFYPPDFLDRLPGIVPDLRGVLDLPGCGHWTQQERPEEVNKALLEFLAGL
ncbi:pimeloyl-ACP methyl ester carboxylesterase [Crossiella equi]|uniref:Pimeloyl-ACP methyl ester carboxylesterase n=1 Tax=Crossiella equi TaxID=130796 RepID=A0ABS5AMV1_9PSEU|nr:alpha/beta hydrolase [Crossiella equi]MBP2477899.1 pimeloyl-ACP methyl ester carboxylesterase [Crossiella equi]